MIIKMNITYSINRLNKNGKISKQKPKYKGDEILQTVSVLHSIENNNPGKQFAIVANFN